MAGRLLETWFEGSLEECQAHRRRTGLMLNRKPASTHLWRYNHYVPQGTVAHQALTLTGLPLQRFRSPLYLLALTIWLPQIETTARDTWPTCTPLSTPVDFRLYREASEYTSLA